MSVGVKLYTQMRDKFYKNFQQEILPQVSKFEDERKNLLKKTILQSIGLFFLSIIFFMIPHFCFWIFGFNFFILSIVIYSFVKKEFENKIKKIIMPSVASCFENLSWKNGGASKAYVYEFTQIVPQHDIWFNDDVFEGNYNGVNFEINETRLLKERIPQHIDKNGREVEAKYSEVFKGIIIKFNMNKNFTGLTLIKPETISHSSPQEYLRRTTLESVDFEKKYDVFTTDEVEARYIITTAFMNRLDNIKLAFKVKEISCAFYNNNLYIALPTKKDVFSICALNKSLKDSQPYFQMYEEIVSIIKLIDHFKLDQKIGL